jgi:hypothetical protein
VTLRAVILGAIAGLAIAAFGYISDQILRLESIGAGHQLPVGVLGLVIVSLMTINPLLFRLRPRLALRSPELAVIVMLMMVACSIPGRGLMEQFTQVLVLPGYWETQRPGWRKTDILGYVPRSMLVRAGADDGQVVAGYMRGMAMEHGGRVPVSAVPWSAWAAPLATWMPIILLTAACMVCMALIVHRQWSVRERLRYPIAGFVSQVIERPADRPVGGLFRNRLFWGGLCVILGIRLLNYTHVWLPERAIEIPMYLDFSAILQKWPWLSGIPGAWYLARIRIYPVAVAFSYFLSKEISLTLGGAQIVYILSMSVLVGFGVHVGTHYDTGGPMGWLRGGAYVALAALLVHQGRRYYADLARAALWRPRGGVERHAVWALRLIVPCMMVIVGLLVAHGLPWTFAVLLLVLTLVSFLGVARISAETGLFFIQPGWQAYALLTGLFGGYALGPVGLVITGLFCAVVSIDQSMSVMPYLTNALKIADDKRVPPGRAGAGSFALYAAGAVLAVGVGLWATYQWGYPENGWSRRRIPTAFFRHAVARVSDLTQAGQLAGSQQGGALERLARAEPERGAVPFALAGAGGVLVFGLLRRRLPHWPLHPLMFLVFGTYPIGMFWFSFLLGWGIKHVVCGLFGYHVYDRTKPLWLGVVAGELVSSLAIIAHGDVYYAATGLLPKRYSFWPR